MSDQTEPKNPPQDKPAPKEEKKDEAPKGKAPPPAGQKIKELDRNMWEPKLKGGFM